MLCYTRLLIELLLAASLYGSHTSGAAVELEDGPSVNLKRRALEEAPNGYVPQRVACPQAGLRIRPTRDLSPRERDWLGKRRQKTIAPMKEFLTRINIDGFDGGKYIEQVSSNLKNLPNIGIAFSGGGYRAMLNGAGALAAFDNRSPGSQNEGHIGGVLQASTYVSGLSGGGWLVGSVWTNNFSSVHENMNSPSPLWDFKDDLLRGPPMRRIRTVLGVISFVKEMFDTVMDKRNAKYDTSVTDFWSRALSYRLINATNGGPGYTWSSIANQPGFPEGNHPMPILVAVERLADQYVVSANATVFEFNPYEMGSWDPMLAGMVSLRFVGSQFENGQVVNGQCAAGLDNAAFVMGTSSSLFNAVAMGLEQAASNEVKGLQVLLYRIAGRLARKDNDIASWTPNPFKGFRKGEIKDVNAEKLSLVDGGMDGQNIPLHPLIQTKRELDVIFAIDSSGNTRIGGGWPNGTALIQTYRRSLVPQMKNGTSFPAIPDSNTFVNLGLLTKPTFFGCDINNQTGSTPLLVYIPNHPYTFWSNISTFALTIDRDDRNDLINNGYNIATMGNGTGDAKWSQCVGCAIISRSLGRTKTAVPKTCTDCFTKYCWDGKLDSRPTTYDPSMLHPVGAAIRALARRRSQAAPQVAPPLVSMIIAMAFVFF